MTRRAHWFAELLVIAFLFVIYDVVANLATVRAAQAYGHGRDLLSLSPWNVELSANQLLAGIGWLGDLAAYYYDFAHAVVTISVLLLCYALRPVAYRAARTALLLISLAALGIFWIYPAAPPRLLPDQGFIDIVADSGTWGAWEHGAVVTSRANEFAAMPSLHLAWAVWVALAVWSMTDRRWLRVAVCGHVALTAIVSVFTGNHYLIDLLAGAVLAVAAWLASQQLHRQPAGSL